MCLRNLFGGDVNCTWLLFIIAIILLIDGSDCSNQCGQCGNTASGYCGCGC